MTDPAPTEPTGESGQTPAPRPPVPQFGEYATPEEQRRRIQAHAPAPRASEPPSAPEPAPAPVAASSSWRTIDRITTVSFVVYGLVNVLGTIPQLADYAGYVTRAFAIVGIDAELSDPASARAWGIGAALVMGIGWLLTAVFAALWLRAGRVSFWIPIAGLLVFATVSGILLSVPILTDPALLSSIGAG